MGGSEHREREQEGRMDDSGEIGLCIGEYLLDSLRSLVFANALLLATNRMLMCSTTLGHQWSDV